MLSPGDGFKWIDKNIVIDKIAKTDILPNEVIYPQNIKIKWQ